MPKYSYIVTLLLLTAAHIEGHTQQVANPADNIPVTPAAVSPAGTYPLLYNMTYGEPQNYMRTLIPDQPVTTADVNIKHRQVTEYFDGLGRPLQTVAKRGHADGNDIVQPYVYDAVGRQSINYLPYARPEHQSIGEFDHLPKARLEDFYPAAEGQEPYNQTLFDNSPLNRPVKQMAQGKSWVGSGRGAILDYRSNFSSASTGGFNPILHVAVGGFPRFIMPNDLVPSYAGNYEDGALYINAVKDEDGNVVEEISDKKGRLLVKRSQIAHQYGLAVATIPFPDNYNYTFYVYDDLDRLRCVLPPGSVTLSKTMNISGNTYTYTYNWSINSAQVAELCYRYKYDALGRVIEKKIPGKLIEYFVYDSRDRVVLSQDGNLRQSGKWAFSFYDGQNRPTISGLVSLSESRSSLQSQATNPNAVIPVNSWRYYVLNYNTLSNSALYPASMSVAEILTYSYYDNYSQLSLSFDATKIPVPPSGDATVIASTYSTVTKGMLTGTKVKVMEPANPNLNLWISTAYFYDAKGRMIQTVNNNLKGGMDYNSQLYYFQGMPFQDVSHHHNPVAQSIPGATAALNHIKLDKIYRRNLGYGGNEQVWQLQQTINDGTPYNLAYYDYDHMGRTIVKQYTMANVLQEYNIRGWLKLIHARNPMYTDSTYFKEDLFYDDGFASKLYNGNIAGITWNNYGVIPVSDVGRNAYGYSYDKLGRLIHAEYRNVPPHYAWVKHNKDYTASGITYDERGNLLSMTQMGNDISGPVEMDKLSYQYTANSNKLVKVSDNGVATTSTPLPDFKDNANLPEEYTYDNNGNLLTDANKSITSISYTYLNKPSVITVQGKGSITYVYDALGNRLQKRVNDFVAQTTETWDYIGSFVYKNNVLQYVLNEEGRSRPEVVIDGPQAGATKFVYEYFIKDHLGNVRTTLSAEPSTHEYYARHEMATANSEQLIFDNIAAVRDDKPGSTSPGDLKAARLNASDADRRIGTAIMLRVMPGDQFTFATDAYFEADEKPQDYNHTKTEEVVASLLATLSGGTVGGKPVSETQSGKIINDIFSKPETISGIDALLQKDINSNTVPKAGLNYLFFDEKMNLLSGSGRLSVDLANEGTFDNISTTGPVVTEPGYVIVYVDNQTIGKDVWFDDVQVLHYNTRVLEENHYYPFGLTIATTAAGITEQPLKYNGKELEKSFGLEQYDFGARIYDPQIGRWQSVDPLAEYMRRHSPYNYAFNNPIRFIDKDGRRPEVYIEANAKGADVKKIITAMLATQMLDAGTSLSITRNLNTGKLSATGNAVTPVDKRLEQAINDPQIRVFLKSTDDKSVGSGTFMGNTFTPGLLPGKFDDQVQTLQFIKPQQMDIAEKYYKKPGADMLHETIESYEGGVESLRTGISAKNSKIDSKYYDAAHKAANDLGAIQSGPVFEEPRDAKGNLVEMNDPTRVRVDYVVDDGVQKPVIIQTNQ